MLEPSGSSDPTSKPPLAKPPLARLAASSHRQQRGPSPAEQCHDRQVRVDDFFTESGLGLPYESRWFNHQLAVTLRSGSLPGRSDVEVAVPLARLVHDQFERFGTDGQQELTEESARDALLALRAVANRLGIEDFDPPFRDYGSFRSYWIQQGMAGSGGWQARRTVLYGIFEPLHDRLAEIEAQALTSTLATPISPHGRTGWPTVDQEIAELRRHFSTARSPQDYRGIGNDCVHITEALSRLLYDPSHHLRVGESEPPIDKTKQRLGRFVEDAVPGPENAAIRKVAVATIEMAQHVKHSSTPNRREAGIAADAVIQLANILRRLAEP